MERIHFPVVSGEYVTVYRPRGDLYRGGYTQHLQANTLYEEWTANNFSILSTLWKTGWIIAPPRILSHSRSRRFCR